jgi:hypothetical protein
VCRGFKSLLRYQHTPPATLWKNRRGEQLRQVAVDLDGEASPFLRNVKDDRGDQVAQDVRVSSRTRSALSGARESSISLAVVLQPITAFHVLLSV